jgi:hypothetical protein
MIARDNTPRATQAQIDFLEILFGDLQFNRAQRNDYLSERLEREVKFLDDLSIGEASKLIEELKEQKEDAREDDYEQDPWYDE